MTIRTSAIVVLAGSAAVYLLHEAAVVVVPTLISLLLAYTLEPIVEFMMRGHLPRVAAVTLTFAVIAVLAAGGARRGIDAVNGFVSNAPHAAAEIGRAISTARSNRDRSPLDRLQRAASELEGAVARPAPPARGVKRVAAVAHGFDVRTHLLQAGIATMAASARVIVVLVLTFLMLCAGDLMKRKLILLGGDTFARRKLTAEVIRAIDRQIQRYLIARLLISAIVAGGTALGLALVGVAHPIAWGLVAGVLNVLPFIGPTVAVAMITAAAFLQFRALPPTAMAWIASTSVAVLEGNLLTPWLTSRAAEVNTVAVFASVLFWGWMWDTWGMFLAVPIMVVIKAAADHIEPLAPVGELLGR